VISALLWGLVKLSKTYFYTVDYHMHYTHVPDNLVLVGASDTLLTLQIRIQGFDFFTERYFINRDRHHDVDMKRVRIRYRDHQLFGFLLANSIAKDISSNSVFPMEVVSISPDTLFFRFEHKGAPNIK